MVLIILGENEIVFITLQNKTNFLNIQKNIVHNKVNKPSNYNVS